MKGDNYFRKHPVLANIVIIILVAFIGIWIVYLSLSIFTRHTESARVPNVENMSFTQALKTLHSQGFRTDIRDSVYNEEIQPGYVIEQFPKPESNVKPGRKIFLYINAVHPREVIIDSDNSTFGEALKGYSQRQGLAKLEELGFRKITVVKLPGENDRIIRVLANGKPVYKMQKVPVNSKLTVEVYDGELRGMNDSIVGYGYTDNFEEVPEEDQQEYSREPEPSEDELYDAEPLFVQ